MKYSGHRKLLYELSKLSKFNAFITSSDTKRTLMHLFLFTNSAQRELVSICTQSIGNCNSLSLHYNLGIWLVLGFFKSRPNILKSSPSVSNYQEKMEKLNLAHPFQLVNLQICLNISPLPLIHLFSILYQLLGPMLKINNYI